MIRGSILLPLLLTACTVPPPKEPPQAVSAWPVEPPKASLKTTKPKKIEPTLTPKNLCTKEELDKLKTEQERIIKKLDCLLEIKQ